MNRQSDRFDRWILNSYSVTAEGLGLYRIFFTLFTLLFLLPSTGMYHFLGSIPNELYSPPPGPMWLFNGFPPEAFFWFCHAVLLLSLISLLLGFKTKLSSLSVGITLLLIKGFFYSLGKINHDLLLSVVPIVLAFSGWGLPTLLMLGKEIRESNQKKLKAGR